MIGKVNFRQTSKESLLQFWRDAEVKTGVKINYLERVEDIAREPSGFKVRTNRAEYRVRNVLLAIGRQIIDREIPALLLGPLRRIGRRADHRQVRNRTRAGGQRERRHHQRCHSKPPLLSID